ncbi:uncharacterized protein LOC116350358 [Contarinia nasturtii]|uniref:uncharacterized protein LOC116350358 n=1 Tax=Contarinia nasturtii TaxID=265458 RepID=UPI0012D3A9E3|nr:uncharacterized protein LOC116350358 [Contarinia nasturtii]
MESGESANKTNNRDKYCWICHKARSSSKFQCTTCSRSFHDSCVIPVLNDIGGANSECCAVCITMRRTKDAEEKKQLKMLKYVMNDVSRNPEFKILKNLTWQNSSDEIFHPIDLSKIKQLVKKQSYDSFNAFLVDIKYIHHNSAIYSGESSCTTAASKLHTFCMKETEIITDCAGCYENKRLKPTQWRTMACDEPHLILVVKLKNGLEPAKFISATDDRELVKVVLFGHDTFIKIPTQSCRLYAMKISAEVNVKDGYEELKQYVKNVEKKFNCRFVDTLPCTPLDLDRIDEHMDAMFPGYNDCIPPENKVTEVISIKDDDYDSDSDRKDNFGTEGSPVKMRRIEIDDFSAFQQIRHLSDTLQSKFEVQQNELNTLKRKYVNREKLNKELSERLQTMTAEREQIKLNEIQMKEMYDGQVASLNNQLSIEVKEKELKQSRLRLLHSENKQKAIKLTQAAKNVNQLQMSAKETKDAYEKEVAALNQSFSIEIQNAKTAMDKLKTDHANEMATLNEVHQRVLGENQTLLQKIEAMSSENTAALTKANDEIANLKETHEKLIEELRENVQKTMDEQIAKLCEQHKKDIEDAVERSKKENFHAIQKELPAFFANQTSAFIEMLKQ